MSSAYLWIKAFHIVMVTSWFAGLFYLPRLFVNLAMVDAAAPDSAGKITASAERERLMLMAGKLYRFMGPLMLLALIPGLVLWLGYGMGSGSGWLPLKLLFVLGLVVYHFYCGRLLRAFADRPSPRSHIWFRWFNEAPVIVLLIVVVLVVVKPF